MTDPASSLRDMLTAAVKGGETVRIIYHGGSQPGAVRSVRPLEVTAEDLRALDITAGIEKTFVLSRIELPSPHILAVPYRPIVPREHDARTIEEAVRPQVPELEAAGWHVALSMDAVGVHGFFKNGKLRKTAAVRLEYYPRARAGMVVDERGHWVESFRASTRPYYVAARGLATARVFAHLASAVAAFIDEVRHRSPTEGYP